ncbi:hypothetical protein [Corallincola spongiicola]|uniref:Uncharacterized protein n=1 Tax=Corallincola spongiicola TaxID=2520508 RepID=A0ABY1WT44_9GAMM|nr:hypothetical protein [Corallincola spongiicola]TAA47900.1 hypothetical protein EXY25_01235 [Corallincola spongiicola]
MIKTNSVRITTTALLLSLLTTSCGTILHPERRGQTSGDIDPAIAVLNAAGLILFFVPGVIAFAVDFVTGAIYLPQGKQVMLSSDELLQIRDPQGNIDKQKLADIVTLKLPNQSGFHPSEMQAKAVTSEIELAQLFKQQELTLAIR